MQSRYLTNLGKKVGYVGASLASIICACNRAPTARITEPDGTLVKPLSNNPYKIVLSLNREDIHNGLESFILDAKDKDGPEVLKGNIYAVERDGPVQAVIDEGINTRYSIRWQFELRHAGNNEINRGTYNLFKISLDDGYLFGRPVIYTIVADVSAGSSQPVQPPTNGETPIEDLLDMTYAEFVDMNNNIINEISDNNFRIILSMPMELEGRVGNPQFTIEELGNNPCIRVDELNNANFIGGSYIDPNKVSIGMWEVVGIIKKDENCGSSFELLQGRFSIDIGNGNVYFNDSLEVILDN